MNLDLKIKQSRHILKEYYGFDELNEAMKDDCGSSSEEVIVRKKK